MRFAGRLIGLLVGGAVVGWLTARVRDRAGQPLRGRDVAAAALGAWLAGFLRGRAGGRGAGDVPEGWTPAPEFGPGAYRIPIYPLGPRRRI